MTDSQDFTQSDIEASIAELEAGRLPIRAQQRLAMLRADASFTSDLSVAEHHAVRSVGFTPIAQVMGSCVYQLGYGGWGCGSWQAVGLGGYGVPYLSHVVEATGWRETLEGAQRTAIERMRLECEGLQADGIVAVQMTTGPFPAGGTEVRAIGTAVRADGEVHPERPFTCDLTGQDFAKLLRAGWLPCALVLGISVMVRHDDYRTISQLRSWSNVELDGFTELVHEARAAARRGLHHDVSRNGADHVVQRDMEIHIGEQSCRWGGAEGRDHVAQAVVFGTALTALSTGPIPTATPALPLS
jgi:uncharacterized protein YbjQ (UPF0145 family)